MSTILNIVLQIWKSSVAQSLRKRSFIIQLKSRVIGTAIVSWFRNSGVVSEETESNGTRHANQRRYLLANVQFLNHLQEKLDFSIHSHLFTKKCLGGLAVCNMAFKAEIMNSDFDLHLSFSKLMFFNSRLKFSFFH